MIGRWVTGGGLSGLADQIRRAYEVKLKAANDSDRIAAEVTIKQLEERQSILLAEQRNWLTRLIRPLWVAPFIIYDWKILVIDKALGLGATDDLSQQFWQIQMLMLTFYFAGRPIEKYLANRKS